MTPWPYQKTVFSSVWDRAGGGCVCLRRTGADSSRASMSRVPTSNEGNDDDEARQVTVFGVLATPGGKTARHDCRTFMRSWTSCCPSTGSNCSMPKASESSMERSVTCDLGNGYFITDDSG